MRLILTVATLAAVVAAVVWWSLPRLVAAMPGRLLYYVPEAVVERVTTPLPTALPPPTVTVPAAALELALATATNAPVPTLAPTDPPSSPKEPAGEPVSEPVGEPVGAPVGDTPTPAISPTPAPEATPVPTVSPLPSYVRIDGLPIIPQKFNNCGPTNMTIVLNYYGVDVNQFDVAAVVRPNYEDRNVSPDELAGYVNEQTGLAAAHYVGGDIDLLRALLAAGFPVIIEKGLEPDEATGWMGHYLTVFGYDDEAAEFLARDTFMGPWREDGRAGYDDTARMWAQFAGAFIVVYPPERAAELADLLGPEFAEPAAMWQRVRERARDTVREAPDDSFAWFNLGTALTALAGLRGDAALYQSAVAAYDQARTLGLPPRMLWYQFGPYDAYLATGRYADALALAEATLGSQGGRNVEETYYYQGRALLATGDAAGARAAFRRVVALNPASAVGQAASEELSAD